MQINTKRGNDRISWITLLYASYKKTHKNDQNQLVFEILETNQTHGDKSPIGAAESHGDQELRGISICWIPMPIPHLHVQ